MKNQSWNHVKNCKLWNMFTALKVKHAHTQPYLDASDHTLAAHKHIHTHTRAHNHTWKRTLIQEEFRTIATIIFKLKIIRHFKWKHFSMQVNDWKHALWTILLVMMDLMERKENKTEASCIKLDKDRKCGKTHLIVGLWAGILNCGSFWGTDQCMSADIPKGIQYHTLTWFVDKCRRFNIYAGINRTQYWNLTSMLPKVLL